VPTDGRDVFSLKGAKKTIFEKMPDAVLGCFPYGYGATIQRGIGWNMALGQRDASSRYIFQIFVFKRKT